MSLVLLSAIVETPFKEVPEMPKFKRAKRSTLRKFQGKVRPKAKMNIEFSFLSTVPTPAS